jgi:hypothetical protein
MATTSIPGEETEPLTIDTITAAMRQAWPSIEPKTITFVSGSTVKSTVWYFTTEVTLTTNPIVYSAKSGQARMAFTFHPQGLAAVTLKSSKTEDLVVIKAFIRSCKMYMNGIVAAIERAGEEPPPTPEADIFRIR